MDARLFLPKVWTKDQTRCEKAGVPADARMYRTKHELALDIVEHALELGIRFEWVGVDAFYGENGSSAVVVISDEGPGISADFLPMIFERFRQADGSARRGHTGLGLGLALVKELTELHGGTIQVESEVGRGTRFTVSLSLPAVRQLDQGEKESRRTSREHPLTGVRVLYVDDVEDARLMVSTMLREYGAEVESASSARCAADAATNPTACRRHRHRHA